MGNVDAALREAWAAAGGDPAELAAVRCTGPAHALPSAFRVTDVAAASIAAAALAGAGLWADRNGEALPEVAVDRRHAAIACRSERDVAAEAPLDWPDPVTGDHRTVDGWARVHAVYPHHRAAALAVLGAGEDRSEVAAAVARWEAEPLEAAVVAAGGVAAALRPAAAWAAHPHGSTVRALPLLAVERTGGGPPRPLPPAERPLAGVRVLDLTRVIAGPTATKWLAALAPGLVTARLSAWGGTGPWRDRRGFDSLVQTASGIADAGRAAAGADHPVPLPCQLLDHATAYLLALGACAALRRRAGEGGSWSVTASLARTGAWLADLGPADALGAAAPSAAEVAAVTATAASAWGATTHVRPAASIAGVPVRWDRPPPAGAASPPAW